jgi:hypothetical protein
MGRCRFAIGEGKEMDGRGMVGESTNRDELGLDQGPSPLGTHSHSG